MSSYEIRFKTGMDSPRLKKIAQKARRSLKSQFDTKLTVVLSENSVARRESAGAVKKLEAAIESSRRFCDLFDSRRGQYLRQS